MNHRLVLGVILIVMMVGIVGADTLIAFETVDGNLYQNTDGSAATLRNGAGEDVVVNYDYIWGGYITSATNVTEWYDFQRRGAVTLNTSALPDDLASIDSVKYSAWGYTRDNYLSSLGASLLYFTPASDTTFSAGDYDATNFTRIANDITWAGWKDSDWNNWTLNTLGINSISKTGFTHIMMTLSSDPDNSGLVYRSGGYYSRYFYRGMSYGGGTYKTFLTISYTLGGVTPPVASFTKSKNFLRIPNSVTVTDTSTNTPTSWQWSWGDGTSNSTTQNPTHQYLKRGKFDIYLTATNAGGSGTTGATSVKVVGYENYY